MVSYKGGHGSLKTRVVDVETSERIVRKCSKRECMTTRGNPSKFDLGQSAENLALGRRYEGKSGTGTE